MSETVEDHYGQLAPASVDGVDLSAADECPVCLDQEAGHEEGPAGYYQCLNCWTTWAGDYTDASLFDYNGPSVAEAGQGGEQS